MWFSVVLGRRPARTGGRGRIVSDSSQFRIEYPDCLITVVANVHVMTQPSEFPVACFLEFGQLAARSLELHNHRLSPRQQKEPVRYPRVRFGVELQNHPTPVASPLGNGALGTRFEPESPSGREIRLVTNRAQIRHQHSITKLL